MITRSAQRGFTLIELMVSLAIAAILAMLAAPLFSDTVKSSRVQSQVRELGSTLAYARSEAVSAGRAVTFCHSPNGAACGGTWADGWLVFLDDNAAGTPGVVDAGEPVLRVQAGVGRNVLNVFAQAAPALTLGFVRFNSRGYSDSASGITLSVCDVDGDVRFARAVLLERSGRIAFSSSAGGVHNDISGAALTCP